jgi:hypothetical protein
MIDNLSSPEILDLFSTYPDSPDYQSIATTSRNELASISFPPEDIQCYLNFPSDHSSRGSSSYTYSTVSLHSHLAHNPPAPALFLNSGDFWLSTSFDSDSVSSRISFHPNTHPIMEPGSSNDDFLATSPVDQESIISSTPSTNYSPMYSTERL